MTFLKTVQVEINFAIAFSTDVSKECKTIKKTRLLNADNAEFKAIGF